MSWMRKPRRTEIDPPGVPLRGRPPPQALLSGQGFTLPCTWLMIQHILQDPKATGQGPSCTHRHLLLSSSHHKRAATLNNTGYGTLKGMSTMHSQPVRMLGRGLPRSKLLAHTPAGHSLRPHRHCRDQVPLLHAFLLWKGSSLGPHVDVTCS